ncbi:MAG TPA: carbamate kinase [Bacteroidota bacterium]|nr:carbamate kinase [Bacteroidota bacterium]
MASERQRTLLIAVGGNSLIRAGQKGTIPEQMENAREISRCVAHLVARGYAVVLTHGNGPQVGAQLLRSESGASQTYTLPLDVCVAMTQGEIGFILTAALQEALRDAGVCVPVVPIVTQVLVDGADRAFTHPTKPIGPFYTEETAERKKKDLGWSVVEDASRGYRRVVASPAPVSIIGIDVISKCLAAGMIVIAVGGGGIPVVAEEGAIRGVEAVIDKDRASALLALQLKLERMVISTDVDRVYLRYKTPKQEALGVLTYDDAYRYLNVGHFSEGSMKPKIEAALQFLHGGGREAIITNPANLLAALEGNAGTRIICQDHYETAPHH